MIECTIFSFVRDEGTIVVFGATRSDNGQDIYIGVDHRPAEVLVSVLDFENPTVEVEDWQILGEIPAPPQLTQLRTVDSVPDNRR